VGIWWLVGSPGREKTVKTRFLAETFGLLLAILLFWAGPASAQEQNQAPPTPPQLGGAKSAEPGKSASPQGNADAPEDDPNLYLTTDQKAKIKAIRDDAELQIQAAEKDTTLTPEQRERRIKGIRKATRAQVFAVLTPDQQKTWSAEQREKREAKRQPPKPQ
jgi:Spy/CpxP family protein refolding chaperone